MPTRSPTLLAALALAACGTNHTSPPLPTLTATWADDTSDVIMDLVVLTPPATSRFFATLEVCPVPAPDPATITRVMQGGATLPHTIMSGPCVELGATDLDPGDQLTVIAVNGEGSHALDLTVPAFEHAIAHHAIDALATPDGTIWTATVHHGLVGLTPDGDVVRYRGVETSDPWDPAAKMPQSAFITALAPAANGALWIGTATTGLSWFDPSDGTWLHGQPLANVTGLEAELAQTTLAIAPDPDDPSAAWIASPAGLHHARLTTTGIDVERVADGPALSVAVDDDGRVWAGFSTQVEIVIEPPADVGGAPTPLPVAPGALLLLEPGADPTWLMEDEDAVTTIAIRDGHAWIGTPYGLVRGTIGEDGPTLTPITNGLDLDPELAVVDLAPARDGLWLAARAECDADEGRLLRLDLDDQGAITAVHDHSERAFGERDFASVHELADGRVLVSTLVPTLDPEVIATGTARGCPVPAATTRTADLYVLDPGTGAVARFGASAP
ncbi:MAG: hypothetical protein IT385_13780 [Deltaproteobacteria bacterium]|nr:hypothetical protein [Deltaproteobacteria bacterium]